MSIPLDPEALARLSLHDSNHFEIQLSQTKHRLDILQQWGIPSGSKVLELGCGQGDTTTALVAAVGEAGNVVAVDPADLEYGSPYTLGQAQDHIRQGPLGSRIQWIRQQPLDYLDSIDSSFDAAILVHSLWYFADPSDIISTFRALKDRSKRLLLAEWSLFATHTQGQPHVLAALAQASLECRKQDSRSNIRIVLSPDRLIRLAVEAGWKLENETRFSPSRDLADGRWEVDACLSPAFVQEVDDNVEDLREKQVVLALRDACEASVVSLKNGKEGVRSMDVWVASFV